MRTRFTPFEIGGGVIEIVTVTVVCVSTTTVDGVTDGVPTVGLIVGAKRAEADLSMAFGVVVEVWGGGVA
jgi:hypothetical protein